MMQEERIRSLIAETTKILQMLEQAVADDPSAMAWAQYNLETFERMRVRLQDQLAALHAESTASAGS